MFHGFLRLLGRDVTSYRVSGQNGYRAIKLGVVVKVVCGSSQRPT